MKKVNKAEFKTLNDESVKEWGEKHYRSWLPEMQQTDSIPNTPVERFFKYYTQGSPSYLNNALRFYEKIDECLINSFVKPEMYYEAIDEINKNKSIGIHSSKATDQAKYYP